MAIVHITHTIWNEVEQIHNTHMIIIITISNNKIAINQNCFSLNILSTKYICIYVRLQFCDNNSYCFWEIAIRM